MFEQPHDAPRISKSPPKPATRTGTYWNAVRKVAGMRWGTVYTLLVLGGVGIMAADMASEAMIDSLQRRMDGGAGSSGGGGGDGSSSGFAGISRAGAGTRGGAGGAGGSVLKGL